MAEKRDGAEIKPHHFQSSVVVSDAVRSPSLHLVQIAAYPGRIGDHSGNAWWQWLRDLCCTPWHWAGLLFQCHLALSYPSTRLQLLHILGLCSVISVGHSAIISHVIKLPAVGLPGLQCGSLWNGVSEFSVTVQIWYQGKARETMTNKYDKYDQLTETLPAIFNICS